MNGYWDKVEARMRTRRQVSVAELAAHLDHRLYTLPPTADATRAGCEFAAKVGLAAVICRPELVPVAAAELAGTGVPVATAVGWDVPHTTALDTRALLEEALALAGEGAGEVAVVATSARMDDGGLDFTRQAAALVAAMSAQGVRVRVVLDTEHLKPDDITSACRQATDVGAWMVQGGSWRGHRSGFTQIEQMRQALGPDVLLKWTHPIRSLETMLLCLSEGIERFNGDVDRLITSAHGSAELGPLTLPLKGTDYGPVTTPGFRSVPSGARRV